MSKYLNVFPRLTCGLVLQRLKSIFSFANFCSTNTLVATNGLVITNFLVARVRINDYI